MNLYILYVKKWNIHNTGISYHLKWQSVNYNKFLFLGDFIVSSRWCTRNTRDYNDVKNTWKSLLHWHYKVVLRSPLKNDLGNFDVWQHGAGRNTFFGVKAQINDTGRKWNNPMYMQLTFPFLIQNDNILFGYH